MFRPAMGVDAPDENWPPIRRKPLTRHDSQGRRTSSLYTALVVQERVCTGYVTKQPTPVAGRLAELVLTA